MGNFAMNQYQVKDVLCKVRIIQDLSSFIVMYIGLTAPKKGQTRLMKSLMLFLAICLVWFLLIMHTYEYFYFIKYTILFTFSL